MALRWPPEAMSAGFFGLIGVIAVCGTLAIGFAALALQPAIEIHDTHLVMTRGFAGRRAIPWEQIRRVDQGRWQIRGQARWLIPWLQGGNLLAVYLTLEGGSRLWVVHACGFDSGRSLLRHLRLSAREALLDGIPYRQFWGQGKSEHPRSEHPQSEHALSEYARGERANSERTPLRSRLDCPPVPFRYPLLLAEDEAEIEHMFQRLKSAGRLDTQSHDIRGDASLDSRASGEGQG
jgi:PH (Pleckstrin Homology) domain-containing protein